MKRAYFCAFGTSSVKIRLIECQPVRESASLSPVTHFPTESPTRAVPFFMFMTVAFNVSVTVICGCLLVECTVNGPWGGALDAIEGKIQTTTAAVTRFNFKVTSKVDMEGSFCVLLHEGTVLREMGRETNWHLKEVMI